MRSLWKWLGLAGAVGVAAGGVLVVRDQRQRHAYTADEVRARLHHRLAAADESGASGEPTSSSGSQGEGAPCSWG
ncbi:MAG: hypothetical protein K2Q25_06375 [Mycobacteriaceae bacterium]|nr:hypothetical protein [Mycobacteriaceae bacterium]